MPRCTICSLHLPLRPPATIATTWQLAAGGEPTLNLLGWRRITTRKSPSARR
jgi:hypothetical protein